MCVHCGAPHPGTNCFAAADLRDEMAASRFEGGTVFRNSGSSHITLDREHGTHITTEVPGLKLGFPYRHRDDVPDDGF